MYSAILSHWTMVPSSTPKFCVSLQVCIVHLLQWHGNHLFRCAGTRAVLFYLAVWIDLMEPMTGSIGFPLGHEHQICLAKSTLSFDFFPHYFVRQLLHLSFCAIPFARSWECRWERCHGVCSSPEASQFWDWSSDRRALQRFPWPLSESYHFHFEILPSQ
jgi:hypothetical protein